MPGTIIQSTNHTVYGALAKRSMQSRKLMAEGIKKDEDNFDMENDGNQAVLCGFCLRIFSTEETD